MVMSRYRTESAVGYSLIELLVVLGIIAVLTGIILAGVFTVRRKVDAVHCTANLLQVGVATRMYVADYHRLPLVCYGGPWGGEPRRPPSPPLSHDIAVALGGYITDATVFKCPATRRYMPQTNYKVNASASGLRPSDVAPPPSRALLMACPFDRITGRGHGWPNALFLDGHVKAYDWIMYKPLWVPDSFEPRWPPD